MNRPDLPPTNEQLAHQMSDTATTGLLFAILALNDTLKGIAEDIAYIRRDQ